MTSASHSRFDFAPMAASYDSWYETDEGRRHDAAQKQVVLSMLPVSVTGKRRDLLDVGCGTGHWSVFFAELGFEVIGTDISPTMITAAQARNAAHCRFAVADVMKLPFLNNDFDVVGAMAMLEFVSDARRACAEMMRCLKSGGWLIAGALNRLAGVNQRRVTEQAEPYVSAQMFAPEELRALLARFGDVNIRVTTEVLAKLPDKTATIRHAPDGPLKITPNDRFRNGRMSGAFIIATVQKP
ncbi:MAG: class I SAM-dependent methyltransferase [Verrucomicrobiota bacterium]